jgi:hypothetical protein
MEMCSPSSSGAPVQHIGGNGERTSAVRSKLAQAKGASFQSRPTSSDACNTITQYLLTFILVRLSLNLFMTDRSQAPAKYFGLEVEPNP